MKLRRLTIENFRGIKSCDWCLDTNFAALVGPGDSTKTTILDALGLVLTSRYNIALSDTDFYDRDISTPIVIHAIVSDLPTSLIAERSHGKNRSGIRSDGSLEHDPIDEEGVEECLMVRLVVDSSLEPVWEVIRPDEAEGQRITASEREQLGFFRMGDYADQHLRWGRGSALTSLTTSRTDVEQAMVEAQRQAQQAVEGLSGTPLHEAAKLVQAEVGRLGGGPFRKLRPGFDSSFGAGSAALALYDGHIPLTQFGLGTRRLLSLSIQEHALAKNSIIAIDEVESGLDPHRLRHLVHYLREQARNRKLQVLLTTHSPLVVESLSHDQLFVVRSKAGTTTVVDVPPELEVVETDVVQGLMREKPSALLARRVVVGEGATEVGFIQQLLHRFDELRLEDDELTSVALGVVITNGGGSTQAPKRAWALASLGFPTLLMIDGDVTDNRLLIDDAQKAGVTVIQWPDDNALEDIIFSHVPLPCIQDLVNFVIEERSEEAIRNAVGARLESDLNTGTVQDWIDGFGESRVRQAIAHAAKAGKQNGTKDESKAWFKREDRGAKLAELVQQHGLESFDSLAQDWLTRLRQFVYDPDQSIDAD